MSAMRQGNVPGGSNVTDMAEWIQSFFKKMDVMDAAIHDMRAELARRYYGEYLSQDPAFTNEVQKSAEMISSSDNSDRISADQFQDWASQLQSK